MVGAEHRPPAVQQLFADGAAGGAVSFGVQVKDGVQDEVAASGRVIALRGGGEHVRGEPSVAGPVGRILGVAGGGGGQQRHHPLGGGLLSLGGQLSAEHRLHQPVDLEAVGRAAGQGIADQRAHGVGQCVGIGGGGMQWLLEEGGGGGGPGQRERVRGGGRGPPP